MKELHELEFADADNTQEAYRAMNDESQDGHWNGQPYGVPLVKSEQLEHRVEGEVEE